MFPFGLAALTSHEVRLLFCLCVFKYERSEVMVVHNRYDSPISMMSTALALRQLAGDYPPTYLLHILTIDVRIYYRSNQTKRYLPHK